MNVTGLATIFVKEFKGERGNFKGFSTTISHKDEEGNYTNATMRVRFAKDLEEGIKTLKEAYCYLIELKSAWLDCRTYKDNEGKEQREIYLFVNSAVVQGKKKINKESNDLPNLSK